jgi:hypothetical protein
MKAIVGFIELDLSRGDAAPLQRCQIIYLLPMLPERKSPV